MKSTNQLIDDILTIFFKCSTNFDTIPFLWENDSQIGAVATTDGFGEFKEEGNGSSGGGLEVRE